MYTHLSKKLLFDNLQNNLKACLQSVLLNGRYASPDKIRSKARLLWRFPEHFRTASFENIDDPLPLKNWIDLL